MVRPSVKPTNQSTEIEIAPLPYASGATVHCGDVRLLSDEAIEILHQAWLDNLVLLLRDQTLNDAELIDFIGCGAFGEITLPTPKDFQGVGVNGRVENHPEIVVVSNIIEDGIAIGGLGDGEADWHSDMCYHEVPTAASALYALEVPPSGGNTGFANMYLAYENLPEDLRNRLHHYAVKITTAVNAAGVQRRGIPELTDVLTAPGPIHPVVRTHPETGQNALYLGRRIYASIMGLEVHDSETLLDELWAHASQSAFTWHHQWKVGDILVWDNRCVLHHRDAFDPNSRRLMHKTQTSGTRPYLLIPESIKSPPHPRGHLTV